MHAKTPKKSSLSFLSSYRVIGKARNRSHVNQKEIKGHLVGQELENKGNILQGKLNRNKPQFDLFVKCILLI